MRMKLGTRMHVNVWDTPETTKYLCLGCVIYIIIGEAGVYVGDS